MVHDDENLKTEVAPVQKFAFKVLNEMLQPVSVSSLVLNRVVLEPLKNRVTIGD